MIKRKTVSSLGLIFAILGGIILGRLFENLTSVEAQAPTTVVRPARNVPMDFCWKAYVQNYEDLRQAGINTEEKAKQHWLDFGEIEGRDYHAMRKAAPSASVAESEKESAATPVIASVIVSQTLLNPPPKFDPMSFRERYDKLQQRVGVKTKEEAMDFSLDFWEKKRRTYSL